MYSGSVPARMRRKGSHMLQLNHIKKEYKTGDLVQLSLIHI